MTFKQRIHRVESELLAQALRDAKGNYSEAAKSLGIKRQTFRSIMHRHSELEAMRVVPANVRPMLMQK